MSSVIVPDVGHAAAPAGAVGSVRFVVVIVIVEFIDIVVVPMENGPLMCIVIVPFSTCVPVSNPLNVWSCCSSTVSSPVVLEPVSVTVPVHLIVVRTAAVVLGSNCDCGFPDASRSVYDCVNVSPPVVAVGQLKLCDDAL